VSVQTALRFIGRVRNDPALADRIRALGPDPELVEIARIAAEAGFELTAEDLRTAYRSDATLRWLAYRSDPGRSPE
jgi:predicted ribosomally synthesized peptide with nif11-like leader